MAIRSVLPPFAVAAGLLLCPRAAFTQLPQTKLAVQISAANVPPGATTQIRLTLPSPRHIAYGVASFDLDPAFFGPIVAADAFSSTGDQAGSASIRNYHIDVQFTSASGGIGRLPGLPVVSITVPILATVANAASGTIAFSGGAVWKDVEGNRYSAVPTSVRVTAAGSLAIGSITPGGGMMPAGTRIRITGTGFTAATAVQIEGGLVESTVFLSAQALDIVLGAAIDLTGKRVIVRDADGSQADFFSDLRATPSNFSSWYPMMIFPQQTYTDAGVGDTANGYALENQTLQPVDVQITYFPTQKYAPSGGPMTITVPPLSISAFQIGGPTATVSAKSAVPIRMLASWNGFGSAPTSTAPVAQSLNAQAYWSTPFVCDTPASIGPFFGSSLCYPWVVGTPVPQFTSKVTAGGHFRTAIVTSDGGSWASLSETQGTSCATSNGNTVCPNDATLNVTVNPNGLPVGEYNATVTITPDATGGSPAILHLTFRVTTGVITVQSLPILGFFMDLTRTPPAPATIKVTGSGDNVPFTVTVPGDWISVTPMSGTAPATLTVTADPSAFPASGNGPSGHILISGPANSYDIFTNLFVSPPPSASPLTFWAKSGGQAPTAQLASVYPVGDTVAVTTADGGTWLRANFGYQGISVSVNQAGLAAGTYTGVVSVSSSAHPDYAPAQVSVTLIVWSDPPAVTAAPSAVEVSAASGSSTLYQTINVASSGLPVDYTFTVSTTDGERWLNPNPSSGRGELGLTVSALNLPPGICHGQANITAPAGSPTPLILPVTFTVTDAVPPLPPYGPPLGISIVNAASMLPGAISPGEIVTIFGLNIGPPQAASLALNANGLVSSTLGSAQVLFDGIPAPLLYASPTQVNAAVPYEFAGKQSVEVTVEYNGTSTLAAGLPVDLTAPGIFTSDGSGVGQAKALNADGKENGTSNPAFRGSTISIFATGLGTTIPPGTSGGIANGMTPQPALPVSATVDGLSATVVDAAAVPGEVEGIFRIRVVIPAGVAAGLSVPITLQAGPAQSPVLATIAVQ